jgi:uncharacterized membrane protein
MATRETNDESAEEPPDVEALLDELEELEETVDAADERAQVRETIRIARRVSQPRLFGRVVRGFDRADAMEALLGSVLFGIPMAVEEGTREVGTFLAASPLALGGSLLATVLVVVGVLYVADIQDVRVYRPIFGIVPRRLVGVLGIAFLTAAGLLTVWGRLDWAAPRLALAQISVAFVPMAIGAALGDILPGS